MKIPAERLHLGFENMFDHWHGKKLEKRRKATLSGIRAERLAFETMVQRAQIAGDAPDEMFLKTVRDRLTEIEQRADREEDIDELDNLVEDAERQGQLRAYICPRTEICDQGTLAIDLIQEWNVPKTVISKLRDSLGQKLQRADTDLESARSALRALFEESDSWRSYTGDYEDSMKSYTLRLFVATIVLPVLAILAFQWPLTFLGGLLCAGAAGSCVSVMAKMPLLDVSLSGELDAYGRRILSRIGVGVIASLIGCALLGWGVLLISIQNQTFADLLNACTASATMSCTGLRTLILLGVPMLFGFSERALASFEQRVFGDSVEVQGTGSRD
jgi:hypothetical protein